MLDAQTRNEPWYQFNPDVESLNECRDRRLRECPILSPIELEQLQQLKCATYDGGVISKSARTSLADKGLIVRFNGWQVASKEGLAVLELLGYLKAR